VVTAAADLYLALGDMDAQVASVLLVGGTTKLGFTRAQALAVFEQRRAQADGDLQAVATAGGDAAARIREVFDLLGGYEALAAQTVLLAQQAHAPALAVATLAALALTVVGAEVVAGEAEHLRVAKKDAFDSVLALTEARALSYAANADESRYLVDLPGATITTFDATFVSAVGGYQRDHADVGWAGSFGTEFRNITLTGERAAARTTLLRYQTYQVDDRRIRQLATGGRLDDAIAFCTSYQPGQSAPGGPN
jgi:hypothetical protein